MALAFYYEAIPKELFAGLFTILTAKALDLALEASAALDKYENLEWALEFTNSTLKDICLAETALGLFHYTNDLAQRAELERYSAEIALSRLVS